MFRINFYRVSLDFSFRNTKLIVVYVIERITTPIRNVHSRWVYSDLALNKICFWHFITMSQSTKRRWNSGPSTPSSTSKKNSRTSGKNHTTGYSQVRSEMIWHFALCVVLTSVLLQGDCMILRDTQRPVYIRKQSLLLTKPPNCTSLCQQNQLMTKWPGLKLYSATL